MAITMALVSARSLLQQCLFRDARSQFADSTWLDVAARTGCFAVLQRQAPSPQRRLLTPALYSHLPTQEASACVSQKEEKDGMHVENTRVSWSHLASLQKPQCASSGPARLRLPSIETSLRFSGLGRPVLLTALHGLLCPASFSSGMSRHSSRRGFSTATPAAAREQPNRRKVPMVRTTREEQIPYYPETRLDNRERHRWILYAISGVCIVVYLGWQYAETSLKKHNDAKPLEFMNRNFMMNILLLLNGGWYTLFTASLSHQETWHLMVNLLSFTSLGGLVIANIGPQKFLGLMLISSAVSNAFSVVYHTYVSPRLREPGTEVIFNGRDMTPYIYRSLGLSGCVCAIIGMLAGMAPRGQLLLFFVLPLRMSTIAATTFLIDGTNLCLPDKYRPALLQNIDSAAHIGGLLTGLFLWRFVRWAPRRLGPVSQT